MDYKDEIIKIINKINNETVLRLLYKFALAGLRETGESN